MKTARPAPGLALILALALAASACAPLAAGPRAPDQDALLSCRARADDICKARYTEPWNRAVQDCLASPLEQDR